MKGAHMFHRKPTTEKTGLENAIDAILAEMQTVSSTDEKYAEMTVQLERLYKLKEIDAPKSLSPDTLALVLGNLAGIVLIIGHERANVITSKALNFVMKLR